MNEQQIEHLLIRFRGMGFEKCRENLKVSYISGVEGNIIFVDFYLLSGKLRFFMDVLQDIDPITVNIQVYRIILQKRIEVPDNTVSGIVISELEASINELDYIGDPYSPEATRKGQMIQESLDAIRQSDKKAAKEVYELLLAKYWNRFNFGDKKEVITTREAVLKLFCNTKVIYLTGGERLPPWEAYESLLMETANSKRRSRKDV